MEGAENRPVNHLMRSSKSKQILIAAIRIID